MTISSADLSKKIGEAQVCEGCSFQAHCSSEKNMFKNTVARRVYKENVDEFKTRVENTSKKGNFSSIFSKLKDAQDREVLIGIQTGKVIDLEKQNFDPKKANCIE